MKVIGVIVNSYIFLVSQYSCKFRIRLSLVEISSLNSKWLISRFCVYENIFLQLQRYLENSHFRFGTCSPAFTYFHIFLDCRISLTKSSLLFALGIKNVQQFSSYLSLFLLLISSMPVEILSIKSRSLSFSFSLILYERPVEFLLFIPVSQISLMASF